MIQQSTDTVEDFKPHVTSVVHHEAAIITYYASLIITGMHFNVNLEKCAVLS